MASVRGDHVIVAERQIYAGGCNILERERLCAFVLHPYRTGNCGIVIESRVDEGDKRAGHGIGEIDLKRVRFALIVYIGCGKSFYSVLSGIDAVIAVNEIANEVALRRLRRICGQTVISHSGRRILKRRHIRRMGAVVGTAAEIGREGVARDLSEAERIYVIVGDRRAEVEVHETSVLVDLKYVACFGGVKLEYSFFFVKAYAHCMFLSVFKSIVHMNDIICRRRFQ